MNIIASLSIRPEQASLWFLGQAGYLIRAGGITAVIDPYLSDSVAKVSPEASRLIPVPIPPQELQVDLFLVTHDHLDHLDPETIAPYRFKDKTIFVAPSRACRKLVALGVPESRIVRVDRGGQATIRDVTIQGIYALPTEPAVADTTGYRLQFLNGRSLYHSSDTGPAEELFSRAPNAEVLVVCINGKWGNLNIAQAVHLAQAVRPKVAIPNHYDMMAGNQEDPGEFVRKMRAEAPDIKVQILQVLEPFIW